VSSASHGTGYVMELTGKWCASDLCGSIAAFGISLAVEFWEKNCAPCCDGTTSFNSRTDIVLSILFSPRFLVCYSSPRANYGLCMIFPLMCSCNVYLFYMSLILFFFLQFCALFNVSVRKAARFESPHYLVVWKRDAWEGYDRDLRGSQRGVGSDCTNMKNRNSQ